MPAWTYAWVFSIYKGLECMDVCMDGGMEASTRKDLSHDPFGRSSLPRHWDHQRRRRKMQSPSCASPAEPFRKQLSSLEPSRTYVCMRVCV